MILGCSYALQYIFASVELRRVVLSAVQNILIQYPNTDINLSLLTDEIVSSMRTSIANQAKQQINIQIKRQQEQAHIEAQRRRANEIEAPVDPSITKGQIYTSVTNQIRDTNTITAIIQDIVRDLDSTSVKNKQGLVQKIWGESNFMILNRLIDIK